MATLSDKKNFISYLKAFNIFDDFAKDELETLIEMLRIEDFERRETIVSPYNPKRRVYFMLKGKVKLVQSDKEGHEIILDILGSGEIFGLLAHPSQPFVVTLDDCLVGSMDANDFHTLILEKPKFCYAINAYLKKRLVRIEHRLDELVFRDISSRLARLLLRLSNEYPIKRTCGLGIDIRLTQKEVGDLVGASRESTSAVLNRFRQKGWIDYHHRHICLHNMNVLKKLAA